MEWNRIRWNGMKLNRMEQMGWNGTEWKEIERNVRHFVLLKKEEVGRKETGREVGR